ncbi:MAG: fibronectin/fibrinogen-binding protein, partial [Clostridiales bacterium]|nr:fibronectin/fibrinogen-binding protein [Clostridiales bacterium]
SQMERLRNRPEWFIIIIYGQNFPEDIHMPIDGLTLGMIADELKNTLIGGRIDRVVQPERDEVILTVRNNGENHQLLMSASAGCARAHLTHIKKNNPLEPPVLCMLLRKHIIGGRISDIRQIESDRIIEVVIEHFDELGDRATKRLVCEFMGKHSNIIFVGGDGRIIDSARRVNEQISSVREVLPGLRYELPPAHGKIPYDEVTADNLWAATLGMGGKVHKIISQSVSGMSMQTARELAFRATGNEDAHSDECDMRAVCVSVAEHLSGFKSEFSPAVLIGGDGLPADVVAFPYRSRASLERKQYPTLSEALDDFFRTRDSQERIQQKSASLHRTLKKNIERCEKKLALQQEALLGSQRMEEYRLKGELLTANLHMAQKGAKFVDLPNYYEVDMPMLRVELDEKLSAGQNAQRYFKLYQKSRNAQTLAAEQIEKTSEELNYLEGQLDNLTKCQSESELFELRSELEKFGYVKPNRNRRQMKQLPPSAPMKFEAPSGHIILVGKNNLQNDKLTATAQPNEIWLHAKDMPGSHVIIVGEDPDEATILCAARIAAAYCKGRTSYRVPVDYTLRRHVKKPGGSKPGFVIYTNQRTLNVEPMTQAEQLALAPSNA